MKQTEERIGVLGPEGTFSHQAARALFQGARQAQNSIDSGSGSGTTSVIFYKTIHDVFNAVESDECDKGVVPIENSLGGSVGFTLDALLKFN